jgi:hypothetical protein
VQRGVERPGFDFKQVFGLRADGLANAVAVLGSPLEDPKDEHVEGALQKVKVAVSRGLGHSRRQSTALDVDCLRLVLTAAAEVTGVVAMAGSVTPARVEHLFLAMGGEFPMMGG